MQEAWTAAPMMPASFCSCAATIGVRIVDVREELLRLLAHAAADDDELGPEERLEELEVLLQPVRPVLPREVLAVADRVRRPVLGVAAVERQMAELGVGDERCRRRRPRSRSRCRGSRPRRCRRDPCRRRSASRPGRRRRRRSARRPGVRARRRTASAASTPIHDGSMLAAVSTTPLRTTAGIVMPMGPEPSSCPTTSAIVAATASGVAGAGVGMRTRSAAKRTTDHVDGRALDARAADVDADRGGRT